MTAPGLFPTILGHDRRQLFDAARRAKPNSQGHRQAISRAAGLAARLHGTARRLSNRELLTKATRPSARSRGVPRRH